MNFVVDDDPDGCDGNNPGKKDCDPPEHFVGTVTNSTCVQNGGTVFGLGGQELGTVSLVMHSGLMYGKPARRQPWAPARSRSPPHAEARPPISSEEFDRNCTFGSNEKGKCHSEPEQSGGEGSPVSELN